MAENRRISVGLVPASPLLVHLPPRLRRVPAAPKRCLSLETRLKTAIFLRFVVSGISPRILNLMPAAEYLVKRLQNTLFFDQYANTSEDCPRPGQTPPARTSGVPTKFFSLSDSKDLLVPFIGTNPTDEPITSGLCVDPGIAR